MEGGESDKGCASDKWNLSQYSSEDLDRLDGLVEARTRKQKGMSKQFRKLTEDEISQYLRSRVQSGKKRVKWADLEGRQLERRQPPALA